MFKTSSQSVKLEEPWTDEHENFLKLMRKRACMKATEHNKCGFMYQCYHHCFGLPTVLIPVIMTPLNMIFPQTEEERCNAETISTLEYMNAASFFLLGIFTSVNQFFKFAERYQLHFTFENIYNDVKTDIDTELVKARQFRVASDVFITKIQMRLDHAEYSEPVINKNTCCTTRNS